MNKNLIWVALVLVSALILGFWAGTRQGDRPLSYTEQGRSPSQTRVDFQPLPPDQRQPAPALTFTDEQGRPKSMADFKGKPLLVNLWATWCPPCVAEMPDLDHVQAQWETGEFQVVTISLDRGGPSLARAWLNKNKLTHLTVHWDDPAKHPNALLPTSWLIDSHGRVAWKGQGMMDWNSPEAQTAIHALINEKN